MRACAVNWVQRDRIRELEGAIFNHLYAFFSRYYDEGDFLSLRRYSKRSKYVIPYNGEEILLHWANNDQYYVKTAENFADYAYKHENWTICFILKNAVVEEGNIRGAKRFFVPREGEVLDQQLTARTVPFEFRPLADDETIRYGVKKSSDHSGGYDANKGVTHLKAKGQGGDYQGCSRIDR